MKTKSQKTEAIKESKDALEKSSTLVLTDFTGLSVNAMNQLRKTLKETAIIFKVVKKNLFKLVLDEFNISINPKELNGQIGVVFSPKDIIETSQIVYKFSKEHKDAFKLLGAAEIGDKKIFSKIEVENIGRLPAREVLLAQLIGMLTAPLKSFLFVLNERAKKIT